MASEAEVSMAAQTINTTIQVANTTTQTILQLLLKEQPKLNNPEALIVDVRDIDSVLDELNKAGIPWTTTMEKVPLYKTDDAGNKVLDENGLPIKLGERLEPARTPDGMNCIIMVSGHDRQMLDPVTGNPVLTKKGNAKMIGGNIDRAVMIRNTIRDTRIATAINNYNLSSDGMYKGDYVRLQFPGFESRARFADEVRARTSIHCIIPSDYNDNSLYVRQDMFFNGTDGRESLADGILKEYYFMEQFPEYFETLKQLDSDMQMSERLVNEAATNPDISARFIDRYDSESVLNPGDLETGIYIQNRYGHINQNVFDLTNETERKDFINLIRAKGYVYSVDIQGMDHRRLENEILLDEAHHTDFKITQNKLADILHKNGDTFGKMIRDSIHLDFKDNDRIVDPNKGSSWTSMEVRIDNTSLVGQLMLQSKESDREMASDLMEQIRNAKEVNVNKSITVTMVDGESLSAGLASNELTRESDLVTVTKRKGTYNELIETFHQRDSLSEFQEDYLKQNAGRTEELGDLSDSVSDVKDMVTEIQPMEIDMDTEMEDRSR